MKVGSRTTFAAMFFIAMLALQLTASLSRGTATFWSREPGSALDWGLGATPMVAACLSGYTCYAARSIVPATTSAEVLTLVRGWRLCIFAALPGLMAAALSTVVSVLVLLGIVGTARGGLTYPHTLPLLLVVLCMYVGAALFGAAVGTLLLGIAVPFLMAIIGILAFLLARSFHLDRLLRIGGSTGSMSDFQVKPSVIAVWCAAFLVLALVPLVIMLHKQRTVLVLSSIPSAVLVCAAVGCGFALLASGSGGDGYAYGLMRTFPDNCVTKLGISVCVRDDSTFDADATAVAFAPYARMVNSVPGGRAIRKWGVVSVRDSAAPEGNGYIIANAAGQRVPLPYELAQSSIAGAGCPGFESHPKYTATMMVASEWVMAAVGGPPTPGLTQRQLAWLHDPKSQQWVVHARTALRNCNLDSVRAPAGWSTKESGLSW